MTALNVSIMSASDLLRYGKPVTPLEVALFEKLQEALAECEAWFSVASNYPDVATPAELEKYLEALNDNQVPEDYKYLESFYQNVASKYQEVTGSFLGSASDSNAETLIGVCIEQAEKYDDLLAGVRSLVEEA